MATAMNAATVCLLRNGVLREKDFCEYCRQAQKAFAAEDYRYLDVRQT
jgi:hypothetical protein